MDTEIISTITNIGFPIVACYYMYKLNTTTLADLKETVSENTEIVRALKKLLEGGD